MKNKFLIKFGAVAMVISMCLQNIPCTSVYASNKFSIHADIQEKIDKAISMDKNNESYINDVINKYYDNINSNEQDFNEYVSMAIDSIIKLDQHKNDRYISLLAKQKVSNSYKSISSTNDLSDPVTVAALAAYAVGISLVKEKGCPHTADYMIHAAEKSSGNPSTYVHDNDDWARELTQNMVLNNIIFPQFEENILVNEEPYGEVTGTFEYTADNSSLDAFTALHSVDYCVIFTRRDDGGYDETFKLSDVYNFEAGFGNNYCVLMQNIGLIKPFSIDIFCTY